MPKPVQKREAADAGYPTLKEYRCERRGFLKQIVCKGLGLGLAGGFLASCFQDNGGRIGLVAGADSHGVDTTGVDASVSPDTYKQPDPWVGLDTNMPPNPPDPPELPYGGGAPYVPDPVYVRLPLEGFAGVYIKADGYLMFAVSCYTYEPYLAEYYEGHIETTLDALRVVLAEYTCEELNTEWLTLRGELEQALLDAYDGPQDAPLVEGLSLEIDYCETMDPIDGDMDEPKYP